MEASGGRVEAFRVTMQGTTRPVDARVYVEGQTWPAPNMSRPLGDLSSHTQGVSEVPDTRLVDVEPAIPCRGGRGGASSAGLLPAKEP